MCGRRTLLPIPPQCLAIDRHHFPVPLLCWQGRQHLLGPTAQGGFQRRHVSRLKIRYRVAAQGAVTRVNPNGRSNSGP